MNIKTFKAFVTKNKWNIFALVLTFLVLLTVRLQINHFTTGDEPHYLLMDYSLKHDHDLDLENNYINKDYLRYYPEFIPPHVSHLNLRDINSGWYSFHGTGLPVALLLPFLLSEKTGTMVFMVLVSTATIVLLYSWANIALRNRKAALVVAASLLASYSFNGLAGYLYPDLLIALLALASMIILGTDLYKKRYVQLVLGLALGFMVFTHFRTIALAAPIAVALFYLLWKDGKKRIPWFFIAPSALMAGFFFLTLYRWFEVWDPSAIYSSHVGVSIKSLVNTPAILFDSLRGVIVYNPILFLVPIGLPFWYKYSKRTFWLLIVILPLVFVIFGYNEWHGGYSPNGRYVMNIIPILLPSIGFFFLHAKGILNRVLFYFLALSTLIISGVAFLTKQPLTGYSTRSEIFLFIEKYTLVPFDKLFPTYYFIDNSLTDKYGLYQAIFWMIILLALFLYGITLVSRVDGENNEHKPK